MHITIEVLNIPEEDLQEVERKFHKILEVYRDILKFRVGFLVTGSSPKFFDNGTLVVTINVGAQLIHILRDLVGESLGE